MLAQAGAARCRGARMSCPSNHWQTGEIQARAEPTQQGKSPRQVTCIPSLAKLMPSAGSGISGGTSSLGGVMVQVPSGWPAHTRKGSYG